ncbi:UvrD-helicase domain-containing protein [Maricaulis sp. D1M11]|uniref:UvrD-helicase domain-containing protein n=1 Tax=Maricaulis sp. D1M11 TaxID=3076117 RepID=UPI0039B6A46B
MPIAEQIEAASLAQRQIIDSQNAVYVQACPGAGKTRVLVERAKRVLSELPSRRGVAILTFSNAAVEEIEKRFGREFPPFPSFIGTFDSFLWRFLIAPLGTQEAIAARLVPDIGDQMISPTMGNTSGKKMRDYPLRIFDRNTGQIRTNLMGDDRRLADQVSPVGQYQALAAAIWRARREAGFLDYEEARSLAQSRIDDAQFRPVLDALAARFAELIVDESQDCNPSDLGVIQSLRTRGLPVSVIGDPDQSIYGFRHGSAPELHRYSTSYGVQQRHSLTGNFRSVGEVCGIASLFRSPIEGDEIGALREPRSEADGAYLLTYRPRHNTVSDSVGQTFTEVIGAAGIDACEAPIVAHRENYARRAIGLLSIERGQSGFVVRLANSIAAYNAAAGHWRTKVKAIEDVGALIFEYRGLIQDGESFHQVLAKDQLEISDFRAEIVELISAISPVVGESDNPRSWLDRSKAAFDERFEGGRTALFRMPSQKPLKNLQDALSVRETTASPVSTIHNVKGQEFPAICVVVPPSGAEDLFERLERHQIEEPERVLYVGLTRAERISALAVPVVIGDRFIALARSAGLVIKHINCEAE